VPGLPRLVRGFVAALLLPSAALAVPPARGEPASVETTSQDLGRSVGAPAEATGAELGGVRSPDHRAASAGALAGGYVALGAWMWTAWYRDQPRLPALRLGGDGWLGAGTYAGGADKAGHLWANLALSRLGTELLRRGGWGRWSSSLVASGMCLTAFLLVEVNDGYYTEFSPGDLTANALGALAAVAMSNWPALDDAVDFRVQWVPSESFRRHPSADFAEDYSGQTYLLAFKPRSIAAVRAAEGPLRWLQVVNPVLGLEARSYRPAAPPGTAGAWRQRIFLGVTLDLQALVDASLGGRPTAAARWGGAAGHWLFEFVNAPYTTAPLLGWSRSPGPAVP